jgi:hypothetical protein
MCVVQITSLLSLLLLLFVIIIVVIFCLLDYLIISMLECYIFVKLWVLVSLQARKDAALKARLAQIAFLDDRPPGTEEGEDEGEEDMETDRPSKLMPPGPPPGAPPGMPHGLPPGT